MRVGIPGSGLMGGKLGTLFACRARGGLQLPRRRKKLDDLARDGGGKAQAGTQRGRAPTRRALVQDRTCCGMPATCRSRCS
jgi:8-hydroxy-5-deazaflavin:NADPH oxidoreductase